MSTNGHCSVLNIKKRHRVASKCWFSRANAIPDTAEIHRRTYIEAGKKRLLREVTNEYALMQNLEDFDNLTF